MNKYLSIFLSIISSFFIFPYFQENKKSKYENYQSVKYVEENIYVDDNKIIKKRSLEEEQNDQEKEEDTKDTFIVKGVNYDTTHRIYIDSTNDKTLPKIEGSTNDRLIGKGKKDVWYSHSISGLSLDVTKYAENKNEFLRKYKVLVISYLYMCNFWNSLFDWTGLYGKLDRFESGVESFNLDGNDKNIVLFEKSSRFHSNNEKVKLIMIQNWEENVLNINWKLKVFYHWSAMSIINHASLGQFKRDEYTFLSISGYENNNSQSELKVNIDNVWNSAFFNLVDFSSVRGLDELDTKLKAKANEENIKNSLIKMTPLVILGYCGMKFNVKSTGVELCFMTMSIIWLPNKNFSLDTNLLLNGTSIKRSLVSTFSSGSQQLTYRNSLGVEETTKSIFFPPSFYGMNLIGAFTVPFIYVTK